MNDVRARAKVTLTDAVGDIKSGNRPIRFEIRTSTANVATTGKYFQPCSPMTLVARSLSARNPASSVIWPDVGSSSESLPLNMRMMMTVRIHAITNMIVYHGIAFSGEYSPNIASGVVPNL